MKKTTLLISLTLLCQIMFGQWEVISNGQYPDIEEIDFPTSEIGYACGANFILKTTDGGENWNKIDTDYDFITIDFPTTLVGYAAGKDTTICKTIDGGYTWTKLHTPWLTHTIQDFNSVNFLNENIGFIAAGGYETDEFLETWISYGFILKTIDGGQSWDYINTWTGMESITIIEGTETVYAAGGVYGIWGAENALFKSRDLGESWEQIEGNIETPFRAINCFDEKNIIISGYAEIYLSIDSSETFNYFEFDSLRPDNLIYDCYLINEHDYYLIGENFTIYNYTSNDENFTKVEIENLDNDLFDILVNKDGTGFIVGSNGLILRNKAITSIKKQKEKCIQFSLYPNPTVDIVNIDFYKNLDYEVNIFNQQQLVLSRKITGNKANLDLTGFSSGIYFLEIKSIEGKSIKKILKI